MLLGKLYYGLVEIINIIYMALNYIILIVVCMVITSYCEHNICLLLNDIIK